MFASCGMLLVYAALHDLVGRTIPNSVSLAVTCIGLLRVVMAHTLLPSLLVASLVFSLAVLGWRAGMGGGGDVKMLGATCLLVPPQDVPVLLAAVTIVGGGLACIYLVVGRILPHPQSERPSGFLRRAVRVELWRVHRRGPLPYAVAISIGTMSQMLGQ